MVAVIRRRLSVTRIASWVSVAMFTTATRVSSEECERLKTKLSYKQENAPKDISEVLGVVVERLNSEVVDGVMSDVDVEWTGGNDLLAVGDRFVRATVAIGGSRRGCFEVGFSVTNSDECALPRDHPFAHVCPFPSACVDTAGSYECACRAIGGAWSASSPTSGSCPSSVSTAGCCPAAAHSDEGRECRSAFSCPVDPCDRCVAEATCVREDAPPGFACVCPEGTVGDGERCDRDDCGCRTPVADPCRGRPCERRRETCVPDRRGRASCVCRPGFVHHPDYGCVDSTPPRLELRGVDRDHRMLLGDVYKEHGVDIVDDNAEDYARSLRIRYHEAISPGKCLARPGTFPVEYAVATPWTDPPFVQTTRTVVVVPRRLCGLLSKDANHSCPELVPDCRPEARCVDSEDGGWTCECPEGLAGDGRSEGDGCRDEEPPTISFSGDDPLILRVSNARGVLPSEEDDDAEDRAARHEADLRTLLARDGGGSWCGTPPCATATDRAPGGLVKVDVVVGEPERTTPLDVDEQRALAWRIPHDAVDDAGNRAVTRYREVRVVETSAKELERAVRREVEEEAYQRGRRDEQRRAERERKKEEKKKTPCPKCPEREPCPDIDGDSSNDEEGESSTTTFVWLPSSETMLSYASLLVLFAALWIPYRVLLLARGGGADFDRSEQDELMARAVTYHSSPVPSSVSRRTNHDDHDDKDFRTCPPRTSANALGSPYTYHHRTHHTPNNDHDHHTTDHHTTNGGAMFSPSSTSSTATRRATPNGGPPPPPRTSMFATAYDAGAPHRDRDRDASFRSPTEGTQHGNGTDGERSLYATY